MAKVSTRKIARSVMPPTAPDATGSAPFWRPHPRDLTDAQAMAGMSPEKLASAIRNGVPGTSMPAWKHVIKDADVVAVSAYITRVFYPGKR